MSTDELHRRCAGLFMVGFEGTEAPDAVRALIDDGVYGAILFKRNVADIKQTAALIRGLKTHAGRPFVLAVDQEGGRVARLRGAPYTALPPMRQVGRAREPALATRVGRLLAYELRAVGFDWDFAPVLDVDTNPENPVIGDRALHSEAEVVATLGVALGQALEAGGVASCGKHFPGHGDTATDSHLELPSLPHTLDRLRSVELVPFAAWARAGLASLMTAHVVFDALDPGVPATMSKPLLDGILRKELGYGGVVVSDDLEMKAIAEHFFIQNAVVDGINAGVDLFLVCHHADKQRLAVKALAEAVREGRVSEARLEEALARVNALARRFARGPEDRLVSLGSPEHRALADGLDAGAFAGQDPTER
jgi:beta-N-acetylhexosaminidase